jgi:hypothetical protein
MTQTARLSPTVPVNDDVWYASAIAIAGDQVLVPAFSQPGEPGGECGEMFAFRLNLADCNQNGEADLADIALGVSLDQNQNGIPDECEVSCVADITGNTLVDIDDLLAVISAWGPCPTPPTPCPANIVTSGASAITVDIDDLLAVISEWGPCP